MLDAAGILTRYPEFAGTDPALMAALMSDALPYFNVDRWGAFLDQGYAALVAHFLATKKQEALSGGFGASEGQIASKAADSVSVSFAQQTPYSSKDNDLARTSYGMLYLRLRRMAGAGCLAV